MDHTVIEAFNGRLRDECLHPQWLRSLADAHRTIARWRIGYHTARPHGGLAGRTPSQVAKSFMLVNKPTRRSA